MDCHELYTCDHMIRVINILAAVIALGFINPVAGRCLLQTETQNGKPTAVQPDQLQLKKRIIEDRKSVV